jgi:hypothetical protein
MNNEQAYISGWDELFNKCGEHLNSLQAMKLSPYYRGMLLQLAKTRLTCSV